MTCPSVTAGKEGTRIQAQATPGSSAHALVHLPFVFFTSPTAPDSTASPPPSGMELGLAQEQGPPFPAAPKSTLISSSLSLPQTFPSASFLPSWENWRSPMGFYFRKSTDSPNAPMPTVPHSCTTPSRGSNGLAPGRSGRRSIYLVPQDSSDVLLHQGQRPRGHAEGESQKTLLSSRAPIPARFSRPTVSETRVSPEPGGPVNPILHSHVPDAVLAPLSPQMRKLSLKKESLVWRFGSGHNVIMRSGSGETEKML